MDRSGPAIEREADDRGFAEGGAARMSLVYRLVPCGEHANAWSVDLLLRSAVLIKRHAPNNLKLLSAAHQLRLAQGPAGPLQS